MYKKISRGHRGRFRLSQPSVAGTRISVAKAISWEHRAPSGPQRRWVAGPAPVATQTMSFASVFCEAPAATSLVRIPRLRKLSCRSNSRNQLSVAILIPWKIFIFCLVHRVFMKFKFWIQFFFINKALFFQGLETTTLKIYIFFKQHDF